LAEAVGVYLGASLHRPQDAPSLPALLPKFPRLDVAFEEQAFTMLMGDPPKLVIVLSSGSLSPKCRWLRRCLSMPPYLALREQV